MIIKRTSIDSQPPANQLSLLLPLAKSACAPVSLLPDEAMSSERTPAPLFFDIETTGLSREHAFIYLIGTVSLDQETDCWMLTQWMAETGEEEPLLLQIFLEYCASHTTACLIHYNGNRFDLPFLEARCQKHGIAFFKNHLNSLDLYEVLKPCRGLFQLTHMTQTDLEGLLSQPGRHYPDGKKCIQLYLTWQTGRAPATGSPTASTQAVLEEALFGHNREDLQGLIRISELTGCLALWDGAYAPVLTKVNAGEVLFTLSLPHPLCYECTVHFAEYSLSLRGKTAVFTASMQDQKLRQYYPDYKEYDYLPKEDTAIPKSLSQFLDRSLRQTATPETCYTWFPVTERFLQDSDQQKNYLRHVLPFFLAQLNHTEKKGHRQ